MIQSRRFECPHRLEAQDGALSRPKLGFESPWGHKGKDMPEACLFDSINRSSKLFYALR